MSNHQAQSDRETLSALFDGELRGDSARFALKRLDHDADWREACGRWQLAGDVLRGQAMAPAPTEFAGRVAAALRSEPAAGVAHARPMRGRWIGGAALAASVAVAALFVTRPFVPAESGPTGTIAAIGSTTVPAAEESNSASTGPAARMATTTSPGPDEAGRNGSADPLAPAAGIALAGAAMAVADAPRRSSRRGADDRSATRGTDRPAIRPTAEVPDTAVAAVEPSPNAGDAETVHPFLPPEEIVSRPWPRAVLPAHRAGGAFTASYEGAFVPEAPSFYPFEPDQLGASPDTGEPARAAWPQR